MHDEVEITLIATGFPNPNEEKKEEKRSEVENARSIGNMGQAKPKFDARSMFSNYAREEREAEERKPDVTLERRDDLSSSRVDVKSTNVPPWIEKLRKNKK